MSACPGPAAEPFTVSSPSSPLSPSLPDPLPSGVSLPSLISPSTPHNCVSPLICSSVTVPLPCTPAVHRKEYLQNISSEPTCLQHRVEVSKPEALLFAQHLAWREEGLCEDGGPCKDSNRALSQEGRGPAGVPRAGSLGAGRKAPALPGQTTLAFET